MMPKKVSKQSLLNNLINLFTKTNRFLGKDLFLISVIFICALLLRGLYLNQFPIGITHDELNYVLTAKSLFLTGKFLPQTPPAILPSGMKIFDVVIAEVPALLLTPIIGITKLSLFSSRIIGALLSVINILIIYYLSLHLLRNKPIAYLSAIMLAINPWSFLMGRTVFEVNFYTFFFGLGFLILLKMRDWKILYSLPFYILGFFSYTGGQITFYLFAVITLIYHLHIYGKNKKGPYLLYGIIMTLVFAGYLFLVLQNQTSLSRKSELFLPTNDIVSQEVNNERLTSVPSGFNKIFINKATVYVKGFLEKYLDAYSVNNLFMNGEFRAAFSYQKHGTFYVVDIFFIILGIVYLFQKNRKACILFLSIIAVAPITSGISLIEHSYSQRAGLMFPYFVIFIGAGLTYFINGLKNRRFGRPLILVTCVVYLFSFINLVHLYFFRFPVYASDGWFYQDRLLSRYIELSNIKSPAKDIYIYSSEPKITFEEYLFFLNLYKDKQSALMINRNIDSGIYSYGNVHFSSKCPKEEDLKDKSVRIYDILLNCSLDKTRVLRITRFQDVAEKYLIENDNICNGLTLFTYVNQSAYRNFDISSQTDKVFCNN